MFFSYQFKMYIVNMTNVSLEIQCQKDNIISQSTVFV